VLLNNGIQHVQRLGRDFVSASMEKVDLKKVTDRLLVAVDSHRSSWSRQSKLDALEEMFSWISTSAPILISAKTCLLTWGRRAC